MPIELANEPAFGNVAWQMGKLLEQFQKGFSNYCKGDTWSPPVNLYQCEDGYLVCVDLAGVDKERIELTISENQLRLRGHRPMPSPPQKQDEPPGRVRIHLMEIDHGNFCREVELPDDVAQEAIMASYQNGLLWIELPKKG